MSRVSDSSEPAAVEVDHLTAAYDGVTILKDVTFSVAKAEIVTILGGSGCGKTTLLNHMIGLLTPAAGSVHIDGADLTAAVGPERLPILRRFGVMFQSGALFGSMTLSENIELPIEEFTSLPADARRAIAQQKLSLVGLADAMQKIPSEISGGMRKRAAIARAMALDPSLLFLDEPSAGLDPVTSAELDELILRLRDILGVTLIIVTHELASIFAVSDRAIMLDKSTKGIIAEGKPATLRDQSTEPIVRAFFHRQPATA